ncbi:hypothetical protein [Romboutsia sp.]|uniref:hypothetical protein n=1 Tax=Romboutsia sp. TaxID=1965302 RepID=UPI003F30F405
MKNKFKLILLTLLSMVVVTGCSSKPPSTVVEEYFTEVKKGQSANVSEYLIDSKDDTETEEKSEDPIMDEAMNIYMSKMDVKVLSENIEEDKAIVEVEFTGFNMSNMFLQIVQESLEKAFSGVEMSDAQMSRSFLEKVKSGKVETRKGKLNLTKVDKVWKIKSDSDYNALIFGNPEMKANKVK